MTSRTFLIVLIGFWLTTFTNYATAVWISALPRPRASSEQRGDRHLCRHLQGIVRHGRHLDRRPRGGADQPARRSLEAVGACDHVGAGRSRVCGLLPHRQLCHDGFSAGAWLVPGRLPSRTDLRDRADGGASPACARWHQQSSCYTATCFGQGVGPLVVGALNDSLKADFGANAVRYSLLVDRGDDDARRAAVSSSAARSIRGDIQAGGLSSQNGIWHGHPRAKPPRNSAKRAEKPAG